MAARAKSKPAKSKPAKAGHADGEVLVELRGPVALITLNRPAKRNALNTRIVLALEEVFASLPDNVKAAVIAGNGEHFSAGLDLSEVTEQDVAEGMAHSRMWHRAFERIQFGRVPVVAAMHGAVVGGGLELAASMHVRVADESTFYALPEGQRGIFVGGGGSVRIPRLIGVARMMDMMMTGRTYGAAEGMPLGFSQYVVPKGKALATALELATKIAGNAPMTNFGLIHALPRIAESDMAAGFTMEALISSIAQADGEAKRRLHDFLDRKIGKVVHKARG